MKPGQAPCMPQPPPVQPPDRLTRTAVAVFLLLLVCLPVHSQPAPGSSVGEEPVLLPPAAHLSRFALQALSPAPPSHSPCASRTGLLSIVQMHQICSGPRTLVLAVLTACYVIHMSAQMSFQGGICKGPKVALPHPTPSLMPQCLFLTALAVENHPALFVISHLPTSGRSL